MRATPCPSCGKPAHAKVMCHECRRRRNVSGDGPLRNPSRTCERCGNPMTRRAKRFCSLDCFAKSDGERRRAMRPAVTAKSRRVDRSASAVGLGEKARLRLLHVWRSQGRNCTFCNGPADTIDHLIPLVRGGTNYEGNLAPACRSCNSRKQDRLVIEFRLGLRASQTYTPFRERPKVEPRPEPVKHTYTHTCMVCDGAFTSGSSSRMTCGAEHCLREWTGRCARDSYRRSVGLPVDPRRPTVYWLRLIDAA